MARCMNLSPYRPTRRPQFRPHKIGLAQLKTLLAEGNINVAGNWKLTAVGQRIEVHEPLSGFAGEYVITSVSHKLGDDFRTELSLKEYAEIPTFKGKNRSG